MATLVIKNINTKIEGFIERKVYDDIFNNLSYAVPGAEFSDNVKEGNWDGYIRLFHRSQKTFPTGVIGRVIKIFEQHNSIYEIKDLREKPKQEKVFHLKKELRGKPLEIRKYQLIALKKALLYTRGLIQAATGAGKSFIITMILAKLGVPGIVYVNTKDLLYQMLNNLKQYIDTDEDVFGQIGDGIVDPKFFTVALVQTVHNALDVKCPKFDDEDFTVDETELTPSRKDTIVQCVQNAKAVIVDETQFLGSQTFQMVANNSLAAYYKYGLSATIFREDNADILLDAATGQKFFSISASDLTKMGYLTPADITMFKLPKAIDPAKERLATYHELYKEQVIENEESNDLITAVTKACYEKDKLVLILVRQISHGQILLSKLKSVIDFPDAGFIDPDAKKPKAIKAIEFLKGEVNSEKRKRVVQLFFERKIKILIATSLADQGLDIPSLDVLIQAGRGKSRVRTPQRVGRVVRIAEGKKRAFVFDFFDPAKYLRNHAEARKEIYVSESEWDFKTADLTKISLESYLTQLFHAS